MNEKQNLHFDYPFEFIKNVFSQLRMPKRVGVDENWQGDVDGKPTQQKGGNLILLVHRKCIVRHAESYQVAVCVCVRVIVVAREHSIN